MKEVVMGAVYTTVVSTQGDLWLSLREVIMEKDLCKQAQKFGILLCLDHNGKKVSIEYK